MGATSSNPSEEGADGHLPERGPDQGAAGEPGGGARRDAEPAALQAAGRRPGRWDLGCGGVPALRGRDEEVRRVQGRPLRVGRPRGLVRDR